MRSLLVVVAAVALWSSAVEAQPGSGAPDRTWKKDRVQVVAGGEIHAQMTKISNADLLEPRLTRRLYADDQGHLLVLRTELNRVDESSSEDSMLLSTGEMLVLERDDQTVSLTLGEQHVTVTYAEAVAHSGPEGTELPPDVRTASEILLSTASPEFQAALRRLAEIGCHESFLLYDFATSLAGFLFPDITCRPAPPPEGTLALSVVLPFDPQTTPPDEFEQQFGTHYFE